MVTTPSHDIRTHVESSCRLDAAHARRIGIPICTDAAHTRKPFHGERDGRSVPLPQEGGAPRPACLPAPCTTTTPCNLEPLYTIVPRTGWGCTQSSKDWMGLYAIVQGLDGVIHDRPRTGWGCTRSSKDWMGLYTIVQGLVCLAYTPWVAPPHSQARTHREKKKYDPYAM